ncbi:hypothetical protein SISSUDRAFT_233291 [Sistotremastrum suecicum HHB10207 ss-3]|uniref:DUF6535 domain-containing protein n=1 Tax=Sistotremastrum suecicum HHB10207 ss-3 TaxID=1314776 RepID=A0A166GHE8_9AGAM|nr:hypothetical protein SISSUDRAFT_233291 [Sistotremastrum suecicum HHB10207 ss-3]
MSSRSRRSRSPRFKRRRQSTVAEPTGLEDRPPGSTSTSPSRFDQLLELIKTQNGLISEQKEEIKAELQAQLQTMNKHTTMLKTLETDATKDDKAHEGRALGDAQTWHALDKETLAKIKVMVEEWRDVMQISLVFIALFLTVVTAFISPVIQLFTTPPDTSSAKAPPPSVPTQLVALFYYLALITSISNSVLCVLGIQWGARLIATPLGKTNLERALARERRMLSAEGKMRLLMGVLVWTLLISIAFFVLGFLIQLWELSFSFGGSAPILVVGGGIATGLSLIILGIILVTTLHAATTENSPFESPLSNALTPFLRWIRRRVRRPGHGATDLAKRKDRSGDTHSTGDTKDLASVIQWQKDDRPDVVALKTYAKLVLNTNDVEILERAVPSFEFGQWYDAGDRLLPVFHAVRERFLATDTSFRVKETVHKQLAYLKTWKGWREQEGVWRTNLKANDFTRWCQAQCLELIDRSRGSRREFFPPLAFLNSFEEDNMDLRHLGRRSNEQCVARILCTFDSDDELGDRVPIFRCAVEACNRLLRDGGTDQVTAILSHVERASVLRSFVRNPYMRSRTLANLVAFITKGNETEILNELSDFFSDLPEMSVVSDDDQHPLPVCSLLEHLLPSSLSDIIVPPSLDLSPLLGLVNQHSLYEWSSRTLTHYLNQGGFDKLSDLHPALKLWEFCRDVHDRYETSSEVVAFYEDSSSALQ